jgi:hypothetical protein
MRSYLVSELVFHGQEDSSCYEPRIVFKSKNQAEKWVSNQERQNDFFIEQIETEGF